MVGDSCAMGPGARKVECSEVGSWRGKRVREPPGPKPRNLKHQNPETRNPEAPKSRNTKFHLESLVAPTSLAFDHGPWTHGLGTKKTGAITGNCRAKQSSENSWNQNVFLFGLVLNVWNLLRRDGLKNSGCMHVVIAEV
jgi:hypothetical protein